MQPSEKSARIKAMGAELRLDRVGIARAGPVGRSDYVREWLAKGRAGTMGYLHRYLEQRLDPCVLLPGAASVIVVALNYHQRPPVAGPDDRQDERSNESSPRGRVAMYAWGDDYHVIVKKRLHQLADRMCEAFDEPFETRACVDTAPILEREWAAAAGVGWIGKNTLALSSGLGSYFFLGVIVTTLELEPDSPATDHCGSCTRCLDACPTDAFPAAYEMDASRCISYLTIERREQIPEAFHEPIGDWLFGCDICQQVCPFNRDAPESAAFTIRPPGPWQAVEPILSWTETEYRETLRKSAMKRAKLEMFKRNARIVLRNAASRDAAAGTQENDNYMKNNGSTDVTDAHR